MTNFKELFESFSEIPDINQGGDCFQIAYRYFTNKRSGKLVHGLVMGQGALDGIRYVHAWVEDGNTVIDKTLPQRFQKMSKREYYKMGKITNTFSYDQKEVLDKVIETGVYGPWEKVLIRNKY